MKPAPPVINTFMNSTFLLNQTGGQAPHDPIGYTRLPRPGKHDLRRLRPGEVTAHGHHGPHFLAVCIHLKHRKTKNMP